MSGQPAAKRGRKVPKPSEIDLSKITIDDFKKIKNDAVFASLKYDGGDLAVRLEALMPYSSSSSTYADKSGEDVSLSLDPEDPEHVAFMDLLTHIKNEVIVPHGTKQINEIVKLAGIPSKDHKKLKITLEDGPEPFKPGKVVEGKPPYNPTAKVKISDRTKFLNREGATEMNFSDVKKRSTLRLEVRIGGNTVTKSVMTSLRMDSSTIIVDGSTATGGRNTDISSLVDDDEVDYFKMPASDAPPETTTPVNDASAKDDADDDAPAEVPKAKPAAKASASAKPTKAAASKPAKPAANPTEWSDDEQH